MKEFIFSGAIPYYETNNKTRLFLETQVNIKLAYCRRFSFSGIAKGIERLKTTAVSI